MNKAIEISTFQDTSKNVRSVIFSFLRPKDLIPLLHTNRKCKNFLTTFLSQSNEIKVKEQDIHRLEEPIQFKQFLQQFAKIQILKINAGNLTSKTLEYLPKNLTKLCLMNLKHKEVIDPAFYNNIAQRLGRQLETLKIEVHDQYVDCDINKEINSYSKELSKAIELFPQQLMKLKKLTFHLIHRGPHLYHIQTINNLVFYNFHRHSATVESVHFNFLVITPMILLAQKNPSIQIIKVEASDGYIENHIQDDHSVQIPFGLNSQTLRFLNANFTILKEIMITDHLKYSFKTFDEQIFNLFSAQNEYLETIKFNSYSQKFNMNEFQMINFFQGKTKLTKLGLASWKSFNLTTQINLSEHFMNITHLFLDFSEINDDDIYNCIELFQKLEGISLKCCTKISSQGYTYLTENLFNIQNANFKYILGFGSEALQNLLENSPKLRKIRLANNSLSDNDISLLMKNSKLKEIVMTSMNTSEFFSYECFGVVNSMPQICLQNLKTLDLAKNEQLNDESIRCLVQISMPSLKYLSLEGCFQLTIESFDIIMNSKINQTLFCLHFRIENVTIDEEHYSQISKKFTKLGMMFVQYCSKHKMLREVVDKIEIILLD